ncbi:MAG: MarR family winged helix-turn-helix transcriptional regulator [Bacilli bacterium]
MDKDLEVELVHSIFQFKKLVASGFGMDMNKGNVNINMSEFILLSNVSNNAIDLENNVDVSYLQKYLAVSKAAISQMLNSLEKKGYLKRDIDLRNRRNIIITLTTEGRNILRDQEEEFVNRLHKIVSYLGVDDVKQMTVIINKLIEITDEFNETKK